MQQISRGAKGIWQMTLVLAAPVVLGAGVPPAGSQCELMNGTTVCTFPDRSYWTCTSDLNRCNRLEATDRPSLLKMMAAPGARFEPGAAAPKQTPVPAAAKKSRNKPKTPNLNKIETLATANKKPAFKSDPSKIEMLRAVPVPESSFKYSSQTDFPTSLSAPQPSPPGPVTRSPAPQPRFEPHQAPEEADNESRPPPNWFHRGL